MGEFDLWNKLAALAEAQHCSDCPESQLLPPPDAAAGDQVPWCDDASNLPLTTTKAATTAAGSEVRRQSAHATLASCTSCCCGRARLPRPAQGEVASMGGCYSRCALKDANRLETRMGDLYTEVRSLPSAGTGVAAPAAPAVLAW